MTSPSLENSWVNYGAGWEGAGWRHVPGGRVALSGSVKDGVAATIFTLPSDARPADDLLFLVSAVSGTGTAKIQVTPSGTIDMISGTASNGLSLAGIEFSVA